MFVGGTDIQNTTKEKRREEKDYHLCKFLWIPAGDKVRLYRIASHISFFLSSFSYEGRKKNAERKKAKKKQKKKRIQKSFIRMNDVIISFWFSTHAGMNMFACNKAHKHKKKETFSHSLLMLLLWLLWQCVDYKKFYKLSHSLYRQLKVNSFFPQCLDYQIPTSAYSFFHFECMFYCV